VVVESHHLQAIRELFDIVEPTDSVTEGNITTYLVMKVDAGTFKPSISHHVKKLNADDLDDVLKCTDEHYRDVIEKTIQRGIAYGAYEDEALASVAAAPQILDDLALIRGVYTRPSSRNKGLATSACSSLVDELIGLGKEAMLWVSKDNYPAIRVYEKLGFRKTKHVLLGFKARRR